MINDIRQQQSHILVAGNHIPIVQSILDFDYAAGRTAPSVIGIISGGRKTQKFFWGDEEVLIPVLQSVDEAKKLEIEPHFLLCITSASSTPKLIDQFFSVFPQALGAHLFAEGVTERDALFLVEKYGQDKLLVGPSGVGLCVPGHLKLGAIGGILGERVVGLGKEFGRTAVICSSGGMVNEVMYQVVAAGAGVSFAACYGGDRFPVTSPLQWLLEAENDPQTKEIVYFGELGGTDEYVLRDAIKEKKVTKPVYAYIAGRFESNKEAIQFGHAKALAKSETETAAAKMAALRSVGVQAADSFTDFMQYFKTISCETTVLKSARDWSGRSAGHKKSTFSAPRYKNEGASSFVEGILCRILQREQVSREIVAFTELVFSQLIDHGPQVSGAVNTMITARAGRDISSAVASGLLTIGDRFGGAVNGAAKTWFGAVSHGTTANQLVSEYSAKRQPILGIGHKKYNLYKPDQRVKALVSHGTSVLNKTTYFDFAQSVADITSKKRSNLILNVDGAMSALFIDFLVETEGFSASEVETLLDIEFFNALFIIPRTTGFIGNYLDQKRIDEGLFRLADDDIFTF